MKTILFSLLMVFTTSVAFAAAAAVKHEQLKVKDGVYFLEGESHPFSGVAVSYFEDGQKRIQADFRNGLKQGKETAWYDDGQLKYVVRYHKGQPQGLGSSWYKKQRGEPKVQGFLRCEDRETFAITCALENQSGVNRGDQNLVACGNYEALLKVCGDLVDEAKVSPPTKLEFCDGQEGMEAVCGVEEENQLSKQSAEFLFCDGQDDMEVVCGKQKEVLNKSTTMKFCDGSPEMKAVCGR